MHTALCLVEQFGAGSEQVRSRFGGASIRKIQNIWFSAQLFFLRVPLLKLAEGKHTFLRSKLLCTKVRAPGNAEVRVDLSLTEQTETFPEDQSLKRPTMNHL